MYEFLALLLSARPHLCRTHVPGIKVGKERPVRACPSRSCRLVMYIVVACYPCLSCPGLTALYLRFCRVIVPKCMSPVAAGVLAQWHCCMATKTVFYPDETSAAEVYMVHCASVDVSVHPVWILCLNKPAARIRCRVQFWHNLHYMSVSSVPSAYWLVLTD